MKRQAEFVSTLDMRDCGGGLFVLLKPLRFFSADLDRVVVAPKGLITDLASIPPYVPGVLIPKLGGWDYPAVIHDAAYHGQLRDSLGRLFPVSKDQADRLLLEGMKARGVNAVRRNLIYRAVQMFGRGSFHGAEYANS